MDKQRYVLINGEKVYVTEEVYYAYYRPVWREAKQRKVRTDMESSLDALKDSGYEAVSDEAPIDEIVWDNLMSDKLYAVMAELTEDERVLIDALFFQGKSEREAAKMFGISSVAVHKRKHKTLSKLHRLLNG